MKNNNVMMKYSFTALLFLTLTTVFSQSKTELVAQIEAQQKSIDSLKKVIANFDNIVENRDRSISFLKMDIEELNKEKTELNTKIRAKNAELVQLRKHALTGTPKLITLNNTRANLTIPVGKHWVINQFIADYVSEVEKDSLGNFVGTEIHVFIRTLNDATLTDVSANKFGPQLYSSIASNHSIQFPLVLTEGTKFSIVVFKGKIGALTEHPGNVVCSYIEKDN